MLAVRLICQTPKMHVIRNKKYFKKTNKKKKRVPTIAIKR